MIVLRIHDGTEEHRYGPSRLAQDTVATKTSIQDYYVELEDIRLTVLPIGEQGRTPELAGYNSIYDIPEGVIWRAQVERTTGEVLLNGGIRWEDIDFDRKTNTFAVTVYDRAPALFQDVASEYWVDRVAMDTDRWSDHSEPPLIRVSTLIESDNAITNYSGAETERGYGIADWGYATLTDILDMSLYEVGERADAFSVSLPAEREQDIYPFKPVHQPKIKAGIRIDSYSDLNVTITGTSETKDSPLSEISIYWGDSTNQTASPGSQLTHTYPTGGTYTIRLVVTAENGATAVASKDVTLQSGTSGGGDGGGGSILTFPDYFPDFQGSLIDTDGDGDLNLSLSAENVEGADTYEWVVTDAILVESGRVNLNKTYTGTSVFNDGFDKSIKEVNYKLTVSNSNTSETRFGVAKRTLGQFPRSRTLSQVALTSQSKGASETSSWPEPMFQLTYDRADQQVQQGFTPFCGGGGWLGLPAWTVDRFVEEVLKFAGWRVRVEYASFPSKEVTLTFYRQEWPPVADQVPIDDTSLDDGSGVVLERQGTWSLSLRHGESDHKPAPKAFGENSDEFPELIEPGSPPPWMFTAPSRWDANLRTPRSRIDAVDDIEPLDIEREVESELQLPAMQKVAVPSTYQNGDQLVIGVPIHPNPNPGPGPGPGFEDYPSFDGISPPNADRSSPTADDVFLIEPAFQGVDPFPPRQADQYWDLWPDDHGPFFFFDGEGAKIEHTIGGYAVMHRRYTPAMEPGYPDASRSVTTDADGNFDLSYSGPSENLVYWRVTDEDGITSLINPNRDATTYNASGKTRIDMHVTAPNGAARVRTRYVTPSAATIAEWVRPSVTESGSQTGTTKPVAAFNPASARSGYQNQRLRRASKYKLEGDFRIRESGSPPKIGAPTDRVAADGREWMLTSLETDAQLLQDTVEAISPTGNTHFRADAPPRRYDYRGTNLLIREIEAQYERMAFDDFSDRYILTVTWKPPLREIARVLGYFLEVEERVNGTPGALLRGKRVYGQTAAFDLSNAGSNRANKDNPSVAITIVAFTPQGAIGRDSGIDVSSPTA